MNYNLEMSPSCTADSVSVFDGKDANARLLGKLCGIRQRSVFYTASSHFLFVQFKTNNERVAYGFRARLTFLKECKTCSVHDILNLDFS